MEEDLNNDDRRSTNCTMDETNITNECNVTNREGLNNISDPLNLFHKNSTSTPLSASTRKRRNLQKKKTEEKVKKHEIDKFLISSAFQNVVNEEFPIEPIPDGRKPKIVTIRTPKVKETITWKAKEPTVNDKPPRMPKEKKVKTPPFNYIFLGNCENVAKVNKSNIHTSDDDDDDDDDEYYDYDYDYYDGVAEHRSTTSYSHSKTMFPHQIAATHASKARKIANKRCVNKSSRREYFYNYRLKKKESEKEKEREEEEDKREKKRIKNNLRKKKQRQALINKKRDCIKPYVSSLQCEWSHHCQWGCGYVHLNRATKHMKSNCCYNGLLSPIGDSPLFLKYGNLKPMSLEMQDLMLNEIEHMGPLSSTYGNVLSLAAIGVENGCKATGVINTHVGGFECRGNGAPDCVTMYGRTFHYLTMARDLASGIGK